MRVAEFLVKWRRFFLALTMVTAIVFGLCMPKLNVIYDIAYFLPDDSVVKQGVDRVEREFPGLQLQNNMLYVMFENLEDPGEAERELSAFTDGMALMDTRESEQYTLFQYLPVTGVDVRAAKAAIEEHWGDDAIVEIDLDKNMPADIVPMITLGAILVLVVLLVMCQSFVEVFLFLLSMLIAVIINMGTCVLMPSVSYLTVTIAGVLQMILSMDYSIILTNRYRQEKEKASSNEQAMARAIRGASQTIFSSALTTVVSLLMLMFMKVKFGPDLGFVLSKGVVCSLICNFTVLPSFILACDKAIAATSKKIPTLPFGALARLQIRLKIPLTILFVAIFVTACILQNRTEVSFSALWDTPISKVFPPQNPVILLYENEDEMAVPGILDTLDRDPSVLSTLSYPALMLSGYTASEMAERYGSLSPMVNEEILRLIYYAHAHPERNEQLSFQEMESMIGRLSSKGLLPKGYDMNSMLKDLAPSAPAKPSAGKTHTVPAAVKPEPVPGPAEIAPAPDSTAVAVPADSVLRAFAYPDSAAMAVPVDSTSLAAALPDSTAASVAPDAPDDLPAYPEITYELATRQMTSRQMADLLGVDRSIVSTGYRMAGRTRKPATMSPHEMSSFIVSKILPDKRYSSFVPAEQKEQILEIHRLLDSAFIAGPSPAQLADLPLLASADSSGRSSRTDSLAVTAPDTPVQEQEPEEDDYVPPTPLEKLAMMYMSGNRYSAGRIYSALRSAGVKVNRDDIDLLFLYAGSTLNYDKNFRMSPGGMIEFLYDKILPDPMFSRFIDEESRESLDSMRDLIGDGINALRGKNCSVAMAFTDYDFESPETFEFIERFQALADRSLKEPGILMGESVIYKEFKDDFHWELILLTILTVTAIFIIVLLTFRSFIIPILLIITVMSGVYVNVIFSGLGGQTMYFLSYLIIQSILMGATIDYSILLTSYYREERMVKGIVKSLADSFRRAGHSILTSGLILTLAPYAMSLMIDDKIVEAILKPLAVGALVAILIILLILPGVIAVCDRFIAPKGAKRSNKSYSQK